MECVAMLVVSEESARDEGMLMTVSELSKKYNASLDKYVQSRRKLAVMAPDPADTLASVERMIQTDGHSPHTSRPC